MTDPTGPVPPPPAGPAPAAEAAVSGAGPDQAQAPQPPDRRIHLYDAASTQRERVLSSFNEQRDAILKAVADQRAAAVAPIQAVRARQSLSATIAGAEDQAAMRGRALANASALKGLSAGDRGVANADQRCVAAQIVANLKVLIAEEVRAQLQAILAAAPADDSERPDASAPR